jgi:hypothetical protein
MTDGYWIDQDVVRAGAPAFTELGQRLTQVFTTLRGALDAEESCWGVDSYGESFEKEYFPGRDSVTDFFPQAAKALTDIGSGLQESADTADRGESATHTKFTV